MFLSLESRLKKKSAQSSGKKLKLVSSTRKNFGKFVNGQVHDHAKAFTRDDH